MRTVTVLFGFVMCACMHQTHGTVGATGSFIQQTPQLSHVVVYQSAVSQSEGVAVFFVSHSGDVVEYSVTEDEQNLHITLTLTNVFFPPSMRRILFEPPGTLLVNSYEISAERKTISIVLKHAVHYTIRTQCNALYLHFTTAIDL